MVTVEVEPVVDAGSWLVEYRRGLERGECEWLLESALFDRDEEWGPMGRLRWFAGCSGG